MSILPRRVIGALSSLVLVGLIMAGMATPGGAAFPGTNGSIAFATDVAATTTSSPEIYVLDPGSTAPQRITNYPASGSFAGDAYQPAYSPGGSQIAFGANRSFQSRARGRQIWVMNTNGTNQRMLTSGREVEEDGGVAWSPDGTKIAFVDFDGSVTGNGNIWVMDADGTDLRRLTDNPDAENDPDWSPDGTQIAYTRQGAEDSSFDVWVMNADGSEQRNLSNQDHLTHALEPSWSPDGTQIAFTRDRPDSNALHTDIFVMSSDGSGQTNLTNTDGPHEYEPAWSPDGTKIAFLTQKERSTTTGGPSAVWTMDATGGNATQVVTNAYELQAILGLDWQPRREPSTATVGVRKVNGKLKVSGRVTPAHPGGKLIVTLSLSQPPAYVVSKGVTVSLNAQSGFATSFRQPRRGKCRISVTFVGDADHSGDDAAATFRCR